MKIENQVSSLEQAKKLKELGISQRPLWQWKVNNIQTVVVETPMAAWIEKYVPPVGNEYYAAFTVAELGQMLNVTVDGVLPENHNNREVTAWFTNNAMNYQTEADLRAGILIYLLLIGQVDANECNKRLAD